jgi:hypothetical protein
LRSIRRHLLAWLLGTLSLGSVGLALVLYAVTLEEMARYCLYPLQAGALTVLTHCRQMTSPPAPRHPRAGAGSKDLRTRIRDAGVGTGRAAARFPGAGCGIPFVVEEVR